ncbi:DUF2612 domain-containing protein [bacterium]|nr:DUF2612 domain-containing protein [bacterium]
MVTPVNNIVAKDNVTESAQSNLLYQFKDLPNINKMVKVFAEEVQEIENEVIKLTTLRTLEEATGQQLDDIGEVLGVPRVAAEDEVYRNLLKIRNARQTSSGHADGVIESLRLFTGDQFLSLYKGDRYFLDLNFNSECNPTSALSLDALRTFFPVVTNLRATNTVGTVGVFGFEGSEGTEGFSSIHDRSTGGRFASLVFGSSFGGGAGGTPISGTMQSGEPLAQSGEPLAQAGE